MSMNDPTTETQTENTFETKKTYRYFDLETFEKKEVEKEIKVTLANTTADALERIGNDPDKLLKAINAFLQKDALRVARMEVSELGADTAVVMSVAKPFRALPPFNAMFELQANGKPKIENGQKVIDRKAQTQAIFNFIKSTPLILDSIKRATAEAAANEDSENTNTEETE